ncbi:MAG: peptide chain release factor N(5)-glutamine methyltransferase [Syntrophales bacterium]|nr:peptide chain release factor N(5)-glutamine methyltransferase [Syntrophales bacterium]
MNFELPMDIRTTLNITAIDLERRGLPTPWLDAEVLLFHYLRTDRLGLYRHPERSLADEEIRAFQSWIARRQQWEPVAYIVGQKEFWSLVFEVNDQVLVPRPETEVLVEEVIKVCSEMDYKDPSILDIGTGSGAIGVALAFELKEARIVATDISPGAIEVAMRNARKNGVDGRISFRIGNLFEPVSAEKFDCIVSNPPYVSEGEFHYLPPDVREFEPESALVAGREGTSFHETIIREGAFHLKDGGWLFLEMGAGQRDRIADVFRESDLYDNIAFRTDYAGIERVAMARRKG